MTILNSIVESGIDLFTSGHPKLKQLKKDAKKLHKELKSDGLTLMQCQELIAKKEGFNNWNHFLSLLKKQYQKDLEKRDFVITNSPLTITDHILMGHDISFNNYKWQTDQAMRLHHLILGKKIHLEYDLFLAKQAIYSKRQIIFSNPNENTLKEIIKFSKQLGLENKIRIFDFSNLNKKYSCFFNTDFSHTNESVISELIIGGIRSELNSDMILSIISSLLTSLTHFLFKEQTFSLNNLKQSLNIEKIKYFTELNNEDNYTKSLTSYLNNTNNSFNHESIKSIIIKSIEKIENLSIFNPSGISLFDLFKRDGFINIFLFDENEKIKQEQHHMLCLLLRNSMLSQFYIQDTTHNNLMNNDSRKKESVYLFMNNIYINMNFPVVVAQARSLGISCTFSYSNLYDMENKYMNNDCLQSLIANTYTKICDDSEKLTLSFWGSKAYDSYRNVSPEESEAILKNTNVKIFLNLKENDDNFWILKPNESYHMSIKNLTLNY